jgi:hypothetical protein
MAGNLQLFGVAYVTVANALLLMEASASMQRTTGSQAVFTVPLGYAGESVGAGLCEMDIESKIPISGIEFDPGIVIMGLIPVEVGFVLAGKVAKTKGFIIQDSYKHAINQEASQSLRYRGRVPQFE